MGLMVPWRVRTPHERGAHTAATGLAAQHPLPQGRQVPARVALGPQGGMRAGMAGLGGEIAQLARIGSRS